MTATITVTAGHIAKGKRGHCSRCPVALAFWDAFPDAGWISVTGLHVCMEIRRLGVERELPAEAQHFIYAFDDEQAVEPFTFTLDIPEAAA